MDFNWIDIILLAILGLTFILGIAKGLIRQMIGLLAVVVGLILALVYYPLASQIFSFVAYKTLSHFLGFLTIFLVILFLGSLVSGTLSKLMKGPFKFMNHVLGGGLGLLKGILICGVFVFAMLVFPVDKTALENSQLAPLCIRMTKAVVYLIPQDLKNKFNEAYRDLFGRKEKNEKRA